MQTELEKALELFKNRQFNDAKPIFCSLLTEQNSMVALQCLTKIALFEGDAYQYIDQLKLAFSNHPHLSELARLLAASYQQNRELPQAIDTYRKALQLLMVDPITKPKTNNENSDFDVKSHETWLWKVLAAFRRHNIKSFAAFGSLLGLTRDGKILPFDKDIDIGLDWGQMQQAIAVLKQMGWYENCRSYGLANPRAFVHPDGVTLDLCGFAVDSNSNHSLAGIWMTDIPFAWNRVTLFPQIKLVDKTTQFGQVWHLQQPEQFLKAVYGDWQTPAPMFDTVICAKNLRDFSLLTQCYVLSRCYRMITSNQWEKLLFNLENFKFIDYDEFLTHLLDYARHKHTSVTQTHLGSKKSIRCLALGVFDLFHIGHLNYLNFAKTQGDELFVAVASDELCFAKKGRFPIIREQDRLKIIQALDIASYAELLPCPTDKTQEAVKWIKGWGINKVVVGEQWQGSENWVRLEKELEKKQIQVLFAPSTPEVSSSKIKEKVVSVMHHTKSNTLGL